MHATTSMLQACSPCADVMVVLHGETKYSPILKVQGVSETGDLGLNV